jgi:hypothetical protein
MDAGADGSSYGCKYCGSVTRMAVDAAKIAAGMKLDFANAGAFLHRLAHMLETAVAERTKIERHGSEVMGIELDLAPDVFLAKRESHGVLAQHKRLVRGIALKTATHPLDRWVEMVTTALAAHANENARTTAALSSFFARY